MAQPKEPDLIFRFYIPKKTPVLVPTAFRGWSKSKAKRKEWVEKSKIENQLSKDLAASLVKHESRTGCGGTCLKALKMLQGQGNQAQRRWATTKLASVGSPHHGLSHLSGVQFSSFLQRSMLSKKDLSSSPSPVFLEFTISQVPCLQPHTQCPPIPHSLTSHSWTPEEAGSSSSVGIRSQGLT